MFDIGSGFRDLKVQRSGFRGSGLRVEGSGGFEEFSPILF